MEDPLNTNLKVVKPFDLSRKDGAGSFGLGKRLRLDGGAPGAVPSFQPSTPFPDGADLARSRRPLPARRLLSSPGEALRAHVQATAPLPPRSCSPPPAGGPPPDPSPGRGLAAPDAREPRGQAARALGWALDSRRRAGPAGPRTGHGSGPGVRAPAVQGSARPGPPSRRRPKGELSRSLDASPPPSGACSSGEGMRGRGAGEGPPPSGRPGPARSPARGRPAERARRPRSSGPASGEEPSAARGSGRSGAGSSRLTGSRGSGTDRRSGAGSGRGRARESR